MSKDGSKFANPMFIEDQAQRTFDQLRDEDRLIACDDGKLPARLAYYFGELNALHPFREGNGRVQRLFLSHVLELRCLALEWSSVSQIEMIAASRAVHMGDPQMAAEIFARILR